MKHPVFLVNHRIDLSIYQTINNILQFIKKINQLKNYFNKNN